MKKSLIICTVIMAAALLGGCAKKAKMDGSQGAPAPAPVAGQSGGTEDGGAKEQAVGEAPAAGSAGTGAPGAGGAADGLATIYFDFDSYVLSEASRETLKRNYDWLKSRPEVKATLEGHADERGSDEYNLALGEKRARMALDFLLDLGIPAERLTTISYGEEKPAVEGSDESAWSKNRRVDFR